MVFPPDYGYPHLTKLIESTNFPWLLSNIVDTETGKQPEPLKRFWVTERRGVKIGVIGLVEECFPLLFNPGFALMKD
jgi:5'-nucleotidase